MVGNNTVPETTYIDKKRQVCDDLKIMVIAFLIRMHSSINGVDFLDPAISTDEMALMFLHHAVPLFG
jgi:hypothetical protein